MKKVHAKLLKCTMLLSLFLILVQAPVQAIAAGEGESSESGQGPVIGNVNPAEGATVYSSLVTLTASLEEGDADIDPDTISVKIDGTEIEAVGYVTSIRTVAAATYLPNGTYQLTIDVKDVDGNEAEQWSSTFHVSADHSNDKVYYLALGDSLAAGITHSKTWGLSFTDLLANELHAAGHLGELNKAYAYPGLTTENFLTFLELEDFTMPDGKSLSSHVEMADIITLTVGANDLLQTIDLQQPIDADEVQAKIQEVASRIGQILDAIAELNPSAKVYVTGMYDAFHNSALPDTQKVQIRAALDALNAALEAEALSGEAVFVPTKDAIAADYAANLPNPADIHPSPAGYQAIADAFWEVMHVDYAWPLESTLAASDVTASSLTLGWEEVYGGATEYKIYKDTVEAATVTGSTYSVTGLTADTSYSFKVEAKLGSGVWTTNGPTLEVKTATSSTYNPPGSGGGGVITPSPKTITVSELNNLIAAAGTAAAVTIDVTTGGAVYLPGTAGEILQKAGKQLIVKADGQQVTIPHSVLAELFKLGSGDEWKDAQIRIDLKSVEAASVSALTTAANDASGAGIKQNGLLYEFDLVLDNKAGKTLRLEKFNEPVKLKFSVASEGFDSKLLGIYYLNESTKRWEYIGGKASAGTIEASLSHNSKYGVLEYKKSYQDVPSSHWAFSTIQELSAWHVVNGISEQQFAPEQATTRAEFVTMLVRTLGLKSSGAQTGFQDVAANAWYAEAVAAAVEAGIVKGLDENHFAPQATLTREQMALLLVRAYEYKTDAALASDDELESYKDAQQVSTWALEGVSKAIRAGLMQGRASDTFAPGGTTVRAETAQAIYNFLLK